MRISDWSSDVCSSDLLVRRRERRAFVERHDDIRAKRPLHRHRAFRRQQVPRAVEMAAKRHALLAHLGEFRQAHHLIAAGRSEEHTSELQSLMRISYAVFCLTKKHNHYNMLTYINISCTPIITVTN